MESLAGILTTEAFTDRKERDARRAEALFPGGGRDKLRAVARWLAVSHPRAIDYLEQAPVLVLRAWPNVGHVPAKEMAYASRVFGQRVARAPKLRSLMQDYFVGVDGALPRGSFFQLRALKGAALRTSHAKVVEMLAVMVPPSDLAQAIPAGVTAQGRWLAHVNVFCGCVSNRVTPLEDFARVLLSWAIKVLPAPAVDIRHMVDFFVDVGIPVDLHRWTMGRALREVTNWIPPTAAITLPHIPDTIVDYGVLPLQATVDGIEFVALRCRQDLLDETLAMTHCVHSYWPDVAAGRSRIYSLRKAGAHVATLELKSAAGRWMATQMKGQRNISVAANVMAAARLFVRELSKTH